MSFECKGGGVYRTSDDLIRCYACQSGGGKNASPAGGPSLRILRIFVVALVFVVAQIPVSASANQSHPSGKTRQTAEDANVASPVQWQPRVAKPVSSTSVRTIPQKPNADFKAATVGGQWQKPQAGEGAVQTIPIVNPTFRPRPPQPSSVRSLPLPRNQVAPSRRIPALPAGYPRLKIRPVLQGDTGADDLLTAGDFSPGLAGEDELLGGDKLLDGDADGLLGGMGPDDEDPLAGMGPSQGSDQIPGAGHGKDKPDRGGVPEGLDPHAEVYANNQYPSAMTCAKCHKKVYDEWRVSAHAYAAVSPMFQKFEQAITSLSQGTIGYFCMRCHAPVATQLNFERSSSIVDAPYVYREGVTCVACHRVKEAYGRVHGERRIEPGPLQAPVYGGVGGDGVAKAIAEKDTYKIKMDSGSDKPGQEIHWQGIKFEQLGKSGFCQSCHQVAVHPGIALEVVWAQYRAGPACKKGISCQDCHMGLVPGKPHGYAYGAAADMSGMSVNNNRKHSNHLFYGPGNSIAHPGVFPHNEKALRWTVEDWMQYDWRAGWGTKEFEKAVADKRIHLAFPKIWDSADERMDARKVLNENFELLAVKKASAIEVMESGSRVEGPYFKKQPALGRDLRFHYRVDNISEGHNNPSGSLGAQPQLWMNVVLTGPRGQWLWESGYLDGNGDLANQHSLQVLKGLIPPDRQLFNLQSQFLITHVKGTDREMSLPINVDFDQLPFLRPGAIPTSVMNHPPFIRMEQKSIPPLGNKLARYRIPGEMLCEPGTYKLTVRLRSRMEPIYFMRFCDATPEMERRMLEQTLDLHPYTVQFQVQ